MQILWNIPEDFLSTIDKINNEIETLNTGDASKQIPEKAKNLSKADAPKQIPEKFKNLRKVDPDKIETLNTGDDASKQIPEKIKNLSKADAPKQIQDLFESALLENRPEFVNFLINIYDFKVFAETKLDFLYNSQV